MSDEINECVAGYRSGLRGDPEQKDKGKAFYLGWVSGRSDSYRLVIEGIAPKKDPIVRVPKISPIGLQAYMAQCKTDNVKPIPPDHSVFAYADSIQMPHEILHIQWAEFKHQHVDGTRRLTKQKDWPGTFSNSVRQNWYKLWWLDNGEFQLTTVGKQAQMTHKGNQ